MFQALSILLLLSVTAFIPAQVAGTGTIQGIVQDVTGAVILTQPLRLPAATQVKRVVQTDSSGVYNFPNITIGNYSVSVTAPGFQSYTKTIT